MVLNQSKVLPARLHTVRTDTGGRVEILLIRPESKGGWLAMARPARRLRPGQQLRIQAPPGLGRSDYSGEGPVLEVMGKAADGHVIVRGEIDPSVLAAQWGVMPLPPYIKQELSGPEAGSKDSRDRERYQTVYAVDDATGAASVAAPTAGLHFSNTTLDNLQKQGVGLARVTLHVGPGTFRPPTLEQIDARRLHRETFRLPAEVTGAMAATRQAGGRVIAVGTTSLRVLETAARLGLDQPGPDYRLFGPTDDQPDPLFTGSACRNESGWEVAGETRLFISPPDRISAADGLLTNFHLPGSSLLMLVAALMGEEIWRGVYEEAVRAKMRFFSYGDCMLILPQ